jgi:hypothetical protein
MFTVTTVTITSAFVISTSLKAIGAFLFWLVLSLGWKQ